MLSICVVPLQYVSNTSSSLLPPFASQSSLSFARLYLKFVPIVKVCPVMGITAGSDAR